jgi:hypothetical protein
MEVRAMQGYFDKGVFYQQGRKVTIPEHTLVIVNVLKVPVDVDDIKKADIEFWNEFDRLTKDAAEDEINL